MNAAEFQLKLSVVDSLVDDVTQIIQRVPFIERVPLDLWGIGLTYEFADAVDRLNVVVARLREAQGADR